MNARSINISFIKSRLDGFKLNTEDGSDLSALAREINVRGEEESFGKLKLKVNKALSSQSGTFVINIQQSSKVWQFVIMPVSEQ
jgi:hypothetical protein